MNFINLFLFILQIVICILLIVCVLLQSSDEDSLSGIGAGAMQSNALSHKTSVDPITKITIFLGVVLMLNSFCLTSISTHRYNKRENRVKDYIENSKNIEKSKNKIEPISAVDSKKDSDKETSNKNTLKNDAK